MDAASDLDALSAIIAGCLRRMRLQRALRWCLLGLDLGLLLALLLGGAGLLQARLVRPQFLALVAALALLLPLLSALVAYLWPLPRLHAVRRLDRVLGLQERLSTALEISEAERAANPLLRQQLEDTRRLARDVRPAHDLPLRLRPVEAAPALLCLLLIALLWVRGESLFQAARRAASVKQAVTQQQENIEKILSQIDKNNTLTEAQKQALSQPLEQALQDLQKNPSQESSVSVLTSTGEKLQSLSDPQAQQMGQALQQAGGQLSSQAGSPLQSVGQALEQGNAVGAAAQLAQIDPGKLSPAQAQQLAGQLQSLAQALGSSNPALASQLQQAAHALQSGDTAAAQQALQSAAQSLAQAGQQLAFSQVAGQAGQVMQQGAGQVLAAGGGQQADQPGAGQIPGQGQGQAGAQPGGSQPGGSQEGQSNSGSGHGAGQGQAGGQEAPDSPIDQNNGPGSGAEATYEQIYAPSLLGGSGGSNVQLPDSGQDGTTIGQGPITPGENNQSMVPYQQVLGQYEQVNQQAIDNGAVPFEFMQVVRSYFDSLKP
ncbi:MAG TPA: hypothetical protein VMJ64_14940 [Anaerolineales bacterium]|nr:hypothetical protein [Anaerolineales bacterium]